MPSPIPVSRLLPADFDLLVGTCSSPLNKHPGAQTLRVPSRTFPTRLAGRLWSSVIHWSELRALESIGSGGFGLVFKGTYLGETVAVKRVKCAKNKLASRQSFWAELNAAHLRHPNLVRVIAASTQANADDVSGESGDSVIGTIVMEFAGEMNLQQVIYGAAQSPRSGSCGSCVPWAADIARGLQHLHSHGIVHLDLKPANVVLSCSGLCKLADFGCSLKVEAQHPAVRRSEIGGTFTHRAPELLKGLGVEPGADVYSFGITLWQMLTREVPYEGDRQHIIYAVVAYELRPDLNKDVFGPTGPGRALKDLIGRCWSAELHRRPTADQLLTELSELTL